MTFEDFSMELRALVPQDSKEVDEILRLVKIEPTLMVEVHQRLLEKLGAIKTSNLPEMRRVLLQERIQLQGLLDSIELAAVEQQLRENK